jgi:F420-dependent oxidoreductase-like protein
MVSYALQLPNFSLGVADAELFETVAGMAVAAEATGFESIWVMDHFYQLPMLGGESQPMLEAYTLLGALSARTSAVGLGTLVTGVTYRNPAMLAKIVTTLDVISGGRAWLGIGAAWHDLEHEALGFEFPPVAERMDRLEEALQICRAMFRSEKPTFEGAHYRTKEALNLPPPIRPGGPRILIGGGGERRTLRLVARYGDACNFFGDAATVRHKIEVLHRHCDEVGRDPSQIRVTRLGSLFLTESAAQTEELRSSLAAMVPADNLATMVIGEAGEVAAQLAGLIEAGVQTFIFNLPTGRDAAAVEAAGSALAAALPT